MTIQLTTGDPDRRRSRIGRLIETGREAEAREALLDAAADGPKNRAELATSIGVVRQTVARWARVLGCGAELDDVLYQVDRRDAPEGRLLIEVFADEGSP